VVRTSRDNSEANGVLGNYAKLSINKRKGGHGVKRLSDHVMLLGNGHFNYYVAGVKEAALIECGTSAGAAIFARQWEALEEKVNIKYIIIMHAHFDHACGLPILKSLFPQAEVIASHAGKTILAKERIVKALYANDAYVSELYKRQGLLDKIPETEGISELVVDRIATDGDILELGEGVSLQILEAPGHSVCSLAAYLKEDQAMFVSDAAGYGDDSGNISPVFFHDYDSYINTIKRLKEFPTRILGVAHGQVVRDSAVNRFYEKGLLAAGKAFDQIQAGLVADVAEKDIARELFNQYITGTLACYPEEMMLASMELLIKNVKAKLT
jgi:glyoxylase-like metal-dependent hydrolase (beta-lactamase superfamily II)